jgi:hypothetical protein
MATSPGLDIQPEHQHQILCGLDAYSEAQQRKVSTSLTPSKILLTGIGDSANLTENDAKELLQNVVGWLLTSMNDGTANFVLKKLCSALVTHFIYFSQLWPKCVRQLIYCLDIGRSLPVEAVDEALQTDAVIGSLDAKKMWVAIQFATALVEEVNKTEMNSER